MDLTRDYLIRLPKDTSIVAACEDVGCDQWRSGWETTCDESTPQGATVAAWIRSGQSGRTFTEIGTHSGQPSVFRFHSRQRCFNEHRTRPASFAVRQQGRIVNHERLADWGDDLAEHWDAIQTELKKG
jgi:hypothetical protein